MVPEDIREKERSGRNHGPRSTQWLLVISTTQRSANDMEAALPVCLYKLRGTSKNQGGGGHSYLSAVHPRLLKI